MKKTWNSPLSIYYIKLSSLEGNKTCNRWTKIENNLNPNPCLVQFGLISFCLPCRLCSRCLPACCSRLQSAPPENGTAVFGCHPWSVCAAGKERKKKKTANRKCFRQSANRQTEKRQKQLKCCGWLVCISTHHPAGVAEVSDLNLQLVGVEGLQGVHQQTACRVWEGREKGGRAMWI